jgi:hypothetical protein
MRTLLLVSFLFILNLTLVACNATDMARSSTLGGLRVLALVADTPDLGPGETATISPMISFVGGAATATLTSTVTHCLQPSIAFGSEATCDGNPTKVGPVTTTLTQPTSINNLTGTANTFTVTTPASAIIFAGRTTYDQYNGIPYLIIYTLTASSGETVTSFRRLSVTSRTGADRNTNPTLTDIFSNGASLTSLPLNGQFNLSAQIGSTVDSYQVQLVDGSFKPRSEEFLVSWFNTDGELSRDRTSASESTLYTAPGAATSGRKSYFISVLRDSRGGVSALIKSF